MKKTHIAAIVVAVSAIGFSAAASAQYVGPTTQVTNTSIAQILKNPVDDQPVVLRGYIVKKSAMKNISSLMAHQKSVSISMTSVLPTSRLMQKPKLKYAVK